MASPKPRSRIDNNHSSARSERVVLKTILFVCTENSFRSQIAEAYFNKFAPKDWNAVSAGIRPAERVHLNAVKLMQEEGIDISHKKPRLLTKELQEGAEVGIIVCGGAECPLVFAERVEEWNMPDPARMPLDEARRVRDQIKSKVLNLVQELA